MLLNKIAENKMYTNEKLGFAIAGDWHGNTEWAVAVIRLVANQGINTLYQVGDFGLFPGPWGRKYLDALGEAIALINIERQAKAGETGVEAILFRLIVIPGNHDDYKRIALMTLDSDGWLKLSKPLYSNIYFAPRGHTWIESGYRFGAIGGAGSVDKKLRVVDKTWWAEEEITEKDCQTLIDNVKSQGWDRLDFLLTHEVPAGPRMQSMFDGYNRPSWFTVEIEHYCWTQRVRLREAVDVVQPIVNVHGHWHYRSNNVIDGVTPDGRDYKSIVMGLANEHSSGNLWIPTEDDIAVIF